MFSQTRSKKRPTINLTPMIDVMFNLILFFVVSTTFREQPGIKLVLPSAQSAQATEIKELVLTMTKEGNLFLNEKPLNRSQLKEELSHKAAQMKDPSLILKADEKVAYGEVIEVIDIAKLAGLKKVVAFTKYNFDEERER